MVSVLVATCLLISIYRCIVDMEICAKAEAWAAVRDYTFIIFSIVAALILIGYYYNSLCLEIVLF